jgi:arylsulfatase A-like enzyme
MVGGVVKLGLARVISKAGAPLLEPSATRKDPGTALNPVLVIILFGLLAGLIELADVGWRKYGAHELVWRNWQAIWLTPLSYVLVCAPAGIALAIATRMFPRAFSAPRTTWIAVFIPIFFAAWTFQPRVNRYAVLVLALGLATVATRMLLARPPAVRHRLLRGGVIATVALILGGIGANLVGRVKEQRRLAGLPGARSGAPNILVLVLDTVRGASVSFLGSARATTPHLATLARGGANFRAAFSVSPWTLPSHVAMMTGQYAHATDADWRHAFTNPYPTLAGYLAQRGYATAGFVANVAYCSRETGLARGFGHYEDYRPGLAEMLMVSSAGRFFLTNTRLRDWTGFHDILGRKRAPDINAAFLNWLPRRNGRPFFAFLNYYDAHEPYLPPAPFDTLFGPSGPRRLKGTQQRIRLAFPPNRGNMSAAEQAGEQRAYDASLAFLDHELGRLFDALRARNLLDNTILVVTSDHGEQFGEHGLFVHGNSLYTQTTAVPLLIVYPARVSAGVVDYPVTLADLPATLLALAGFQNQGVFPGSSMLEGPGTARPVLSEVDRLAEDLPSPKLRGLLRSLVTDSLHWILNGDGSEELYRYRADPAEETDIAGADNANLRSLLRAMLDSLRRKPSGGPSGGGD